MVDEDKVMLSFPIDRSLHARLKIGAAMLDTSMKRFAIALLEMGTPEFTEGGASVSFSSVDSIPFIESYLGLVDIDPDDETNT